jgi:prepilin-type processing-associated H-X9-DG protein
LARHQLTAATQIVAVFLCPSDPQRVRSPFAPISYRGNTGVEQERHLFGSVFDSVDDGLFSSSRMIRPAEITDGLAYTLAFAEQPVGSQTGRYTAYRDWVVRLDLPARVVTAAEWLVECSGVTQPAPARLDAGGNWLVPGAMYTHFLASAPPNSPVPDCGNYLGIGTGIFAARSYHTGGVHAAMADGSARWFASSIAPPVWKGLATRSGAEVLSLEP